MLISSLKGWMHNGPRPFLCRSRPARAVSLPPLWVASNTRRRLSSFANESARISSTIGGHGKRTSGLILLFSSLASGIAGYTIANTTSSQLLAFITGTGVQESQYGTFGDRQNAIKELRLAFSSKDAVSTEIDDLRTHGMSTWDQRTGACVTVHCVLAFGFTCLDFCQRTSILTW